MNHTSSGHDALPDDPVEAAIEKARRAQKICEQCGPRPEFDALYCSWCGREIATENCSVGTEGGATERLGD